MKRTRLVYHASSAIVRSPSCLRRIARLPALYADESTSVFPSHEGVWQFRSLPGSCGYDHRMRPVAGSRPLTDPPPTTTSWSRPPSEIRMGATSETRKSPLFQATLPSPCRNAITDWPGPPTEQITRSRYAIGLQPYPALTTGLMSSDGALNSATRSCDQSTLPLFVSSANSSLLVPIANRRSPTMSGVECGPAP